MGKKAHWMWGLGIAGFGITLASLGVPGDCGAGSSLLVYEPEDPTRNNSEPEFPWGSRPLVPATLEEVPSKMDKCEDVLSYSCPQKLNDDGVPIAYGYDKFRCKDAAHWNTDIKAVGVAFPHYEFSTPEKVVFESTKRLVKLGKVSFRAAKAVPFIAEFVTATSLSHDVIEELEMADGLCTCSRFHFARRQIMVPIPDISCSEPSYCQFESSDNCEVFEYHATKDCNTTWVEYVDPSTDKPSKIKDGLKKTPLRIEVGLGGFGIRKRCGGGGIRRGLGNPLAYQCCPTGSFAVWAEKPAFDQVICVTEEYAENDQMLLERACEQYCRLDVDGPLPLACIGGGDTPCHVRRDTGEYEDEMLRDSEAGSHVNCNERILAAGLEVTETDEERMSGPEDFESIFDHGGNCDPLHPIAATTCGTGLNCNNETSVAYGNGTQEIAPTPVGEPFLENYRTTHGNFAEGGPSAGDLRFAATGLPPGLALNADTGVVTGTPVYDPAIGGNPDNTSEHSVRIDVFSANANYPYRETCRSTWSIDHRPCLPGTGDECQVFCSSIGECPSGQTLIEDAEFVLCGVRANGESGCTYDLCCEDAPPGQRSTACSNGLPGVEQEGICCDINCGECGGAGCADRPGGASDCCANHIQDRGLLCSVSGQAPCIID